MTRRPKVNLEAMLARTDVIGPVGVTDDWYRPIDREQDFHPYIEGEFLNPTQAQELQRAGMLDSFQEQLVREGAKYVPAAQVDFEFLENFAEPEPDFSQKETTRPPRTLEQKAAYDSAPAIKQPTRSSNMSRALAAVGLTLGGLAALTISYISKPEVIPKQDLAPVVVTIAADYGPTQVVQQPQDETLTFEPVDTRAGVYIVQRADTYKSIAAAKLGDRRLGYILEQVNGAKGLHPNDEINLDLSRAVIGGEKSRPWLMAKRIAEYERKSIVRVFAKMRNLNPGVDLSSLKPGDSYNTGMQGPNIYASL